MSAFWRGRGWIRIGPLVITTWSAHVERERNAFVIGMGAQRHVDNQTTSA